MRRFAILILAASVCAGWLAPCHATPASDAPICVGAATTGTDVEAVRQQELRGARMNVDGWSLADGQAFFAPDFVGIQPGGTVSGLDAILRTVVDGRSPGWAQSFDLTELDIRVSGCTTAIAIGTAEARPRGVAADAPPLRIRFLNVWRKAGGRWLYWANQFTRIDAAPNAAR